MFANTLVPIVSTAHLVVRRLICITRHAYTLGTARTYPKIEGSSMTRSTRVALCDPHGVSTILLTNPPLEHYTIFSRASMESHATKPSRRWQPPRVTSTTSLQLDHLVPTLAISQCNALESLTHNRMQPLCVQVSWRASKHSYTKPQRPKGAQQPAKAS